MGSLSAAMGDKPPGVDGYRRHLTIVFCDLSESTRLSSLLEPEEYAGVLDRLRATFERIVPHHGGQIVRIDGDGVAILFGHETSHEDTGRRATEAALDLHQAVGALDGGFAQRDVRIRLHTGIHSGLVLLLPGDLVRGRFEMLGDATNVTARLCDLAGADEIVVSESTLGADRHFFRTGPRRLVMIRGHPAPLAVYSVTGRETTESRFAARLRRGSARFVGRADELARLERGLDACRAGKSRIVAIAGPPGIGKTRLAGEFMERAAAQQLPVHRGYCEAYLGARPLQPFAQLARSLLAVEPGLAIDDADAVAGELRRMGDALADPLLRLLGLHAAGGETPPRPEALAPALVVLLARAGRAGPLILHIDDWQWADDASRQLFDLVMARATRPLLVLLSTREVDPLLAETRDVEVVEVPPLSPAEAGAAIESLVAAPEPFLVGRITRAAGGSPLFLEELCHAKPKAEDTLLEEDRSAWLDMLIQARFSRLSDALAELIKTAAVIGHMIPEWLFEAITGLASDHPALRELAAEDFVYAGEIPGTLRFKHGITRDAIYRIVGLRQRKALHGRVVEALRTRSEDEQLEMLAYHLDGSGDAEQAMRYAELAGDKALAAAALDRAQALYRAAFDALVQLDDTAARREQGNRLVHKYGLACVIDPSPDQLAVLAQMGGRAQRQDNAHGLALAEYWLGLVHYGLGRPRRSIDHLERALRSAEGLGDEKLVAQLRGSLGQSLFANAQYRPAAALLDESILARQRHKAGRPSPGLAYMVACRGFLLADQGWFAEAETYYRDVWTMLGDTDLPVGGSLVTQFSAVALWRGEYREALRHAEQGIARGERMRSRYILVMSRALGGYARWCLDRDPAAVKVLEQAIAWFMSGASQQRTSLCFGWLADIMAREARPGDARFYAAHALLRARQGDRLGEAMAMRAMARVAAGGGARRSPAHYLAIAYRSAELRESPREAANTRLCEAELALADGRADEAASLAARARSDFAALGMEHHVTRAEALSLTSSR